MMRKNLAVFYNKHNAVFAMQDILTEEVLLL